MQKVPGIVKFHLFWRRSTVQQVMIHLCALSLKRWPDAVLSMAWLRVTVVYQISIVIINLHMHVISVLAMLFR